MEELRHLFLPLKKTLGSVVEAQACGTPIIAYGRGGALETVRPYGSQMQRAFFHEQTPEDIMSAVENLSLFKMICHLRTVAVMHCVFLLIDSVKNLALT